MLQKAVASLALFFALASAAIAQVTTGTISGTVKDASGGVLPGVAIAIQNEETGQTRNVTTDNAGRYSAPLLSLGQYRVSASLQGFQTEVRSGVVLTVGREAVVDFQLQVGAVTQTVEVTGEAPLVQATESTVGYLVADKAIQELPLNGRDLTQLILLNPGVISAQNSAANSATVGFGKRISISGSRGEDSAYLLDGTYINDFSRHIPAGPTGALLGAETVREFQVLTNAFSAQYGRAMGGVFNAVSKSGTNTWHGSLYEYLRNSAVDARRWEDNAFNGGVKPPFRRNQFGATTSGPITKDRTFFFVAYEGMREALSNTAVRTVPDRASRARAVPSVQPFLRFFPEPNGSLKSGGVGDYIFTNPTHTSEDFGQGRLDHQLTASDSLFARFTASNSQSSSVLDYPGSLSDQSLKSRILTLSETHIVSPTALNTFRFSFGRVLPLSGRLGFDAPPDVPHIPGQQVPGMSPGSGISAFSDNLNVVKWYTNRFNYQDDVNLTRGPHALKLGAMLERLQFNADQPNRPNGTWGFANLDQFLAGNPNAYRGTPPEFGTSVRGMRQWFYGLYAQDDWQFRSNLTLNLGLRWDRYSVPTEVNGLIVNLRHRDDSAPTIGDPYWKSNAGNLSPRIGFAWTPFASARTSVRGGWGLFYVPVDPGVWFRAMARMAPLFPEFDFSITSPAVASLFPDALAVIKAVTGAVPGSTTYSNYGTVYVFAYDNMRTPHTMQYNLNVQQQLDNSSVVTLGYLGSRGLNQTTLTNWNMGQAFYNGNSLQLVPGSGKFNPFFECICYYNNDGDSWYNAFTAAYQRRFSGGLQTQISYTWAKTMSLSDGNNTGQNVTSSDFAIMKYTYDRKVQRSLSGYGVPMALTVNYSYDLPFGKSMTGLGRELIAGWQLSGILSAQRGQPFTVTASAPTALTAAQVGTRSPNLNPGFSPNPTDGKSPGCTLQTSASATLTIPAGTPLGTPALFFDPCAFSSPATTEFGNLGRNTLIGPGLVKWDFSLAKNFTLREPLALQFRTEMFNILNRANFAGPASNVYGATGFAVSTAGQITRTVTPSRQIQFALRLTF